MLIRAFTRHDLAPLTELTIETFRPFYEDSFRPLVGEAVFANQHGNWRDDYRKQVAELHAPERHTYVAVAEAEDGIAGYVAWSVDPARRNGSVTILAVSAVIGTLFSSSLGQVPKTPCGHRPVRARLRKDANPRSRGSRDRYRRRPLPRTRQGPVREARVHPAPGHGLLPTALSRNPSGTGAITHPSRARRVPIQFHFRSMP